ncbi:hypothetical protein ACJZ2D_010534 [Fusarium nematophilum]
MPSSNQLLSALAAVAVGSANAAMGPAFSTGPVASNSWIREATSTLVLPDVPSGSSGVASLWVGMGTSNGDLIQSIADNWQSNEWAIFAYTLVKTGENSQMPVQDDPTPAAAGDQITMHCMGYPLGSPAFSGMELTRDTIDKFDDASGNYTQYVSINGQEVSTLSTSSGHAQGWGSAVECGAEDCGTIGAHKWLDTKIILDVADPNYVNTLGKGEGVTGDLTTSDGGKTWVASEINIPEHTF